jgi:hypothetical protein
VWIFLNTGFVSIVEDNSDNRYLLVRARREEHLQSFLKKYNFPISISTTSDYKYRAHVPRETVAKLVYEHAKSINYTNFKDSILEKKLSDICTQVWYIVARLQDTIPWEGLMDYSKKKRKKK